MPEGRQLPFLQSVVAPSAPETARRQFGLFAFLLGAAVVFHQSKLDDWDIPSLGLVVTLAAVWLMLRPTSLLRFFTLLGLHALSVVVDLPMVVNHWLLIFFAEVGLFVALGIGRLQGRDWARDPGALYTALAPYMRLQVALVYLFAALAKVNGDFLDPAISCGTAMTADLLDKGPLNLRASWMDSPAIYGTIAIEVALPFLLTWRVTRLAAVFVGVGFHLTLALAGHLPFSGFAMAFYALFAPDDTVERFERLLAAQPRLARLAEGARAFAAWPGAFPVAAAATLVVAATWDWADQGGQVARAFLAFFVLYTFVLTAMLAATVLVDRRPVRFAPGVLRLASAAWVLGPLLVVANAVSPYLGLKTQSTFTMYSNLQTEGPQWNHEIVPESVQVFDMQDDLVTIVASSEEAMQDAADSRRLWVWTGLRSWAQRHEDESLVYIRKGRRYEVERVGDDPALAMGPVAAKLAFFRDVPPTQGNDCRIHRRAASDQGS